MSRGPTSYSPTFVASDEEDSVDDEDLNMYLMESFMLQKGDKKSEKGSIPKIGEQRFVQLQISVIDTGVGISEEGLKKLFIDFGKLDENSKRNS